MGKRLTIEYVKAETKRLTDGKYECLSDEYKNARGKLLFTCSRGKFLLSWKGFQNGRKGRYRIDGVDTQKLTIEYVKEETLRLTNGKCECISDEYVDSSFKLAIRCKCGYVYHPTWGNFQQGSRCWKCFGKKKKTIEYIMGYAASRGYELLSRKYANSKTPLVFKCPKGHTYKAMWNVFQQGRNCSECNRERKSGSTSPNYKGGVAKLNVPLYDTYASQIEFCEEVRRNPDNEDWLQVRCTNCNEWFMPKTTKVQSRIDGIKSIGRGENRFYCSDECKHSCPIFGQHKFPKGFKPEPTRDSALQREWRNLLLEERGYKCEKCGRTDVPIFAHHIDPVKCAPMFATDLDNGILLCEECHDGAHSLPNCSTTELRNYEFDPTSIYL